MISLLLVRSWNPKLAQSNIVERNIERKCNSLKNICCDFVHWLRCVLYASNSFFLSFFCSQIDSLESKILSHLKARAEKNLKERKNVFLLHYFLWSGFASLKRKVAVGIFSFHYKSNRLVTALVQQLSVAFSCSSRTVAFSSSPWGA